MALCRLTDSKNSDAPVYINPLEVVAVQVRGQYTWVWTKAIRQDGSSVVFSVEEPLEDAVRLLDASMPRFV